jgi:hypothetical protein
MRHDPSEHRYPNAAILLFPFRRTRRIPFRPPNFTSNPKPQVTQARSNHFQNLSRFEISKFRYVKISDQLRAMMVSKSLFVALPEVQNNVSLIHVWSAFVTTRDVSVISKSTTQFSS